jgi:hypothetical protein
MACCRHVHKDCAVSRTATRKVPGKLLLRAATDLMLRSAGGHCSNGKQEHAQQDLLCCCYMLWCCSCCCC